MGLLSPTIYARHLPALIFALPSAAFFTYFYFNSTHSILSFYLLLPLTILMFLSTFVRPIRYYFRLLTFLSGLAVCSSWGVLVSVGMSLLGKSRDINWVVARSFWGLVAPLVGVRFRVEGEENLENGPYIALGNHQTMVDILCQFPSLPSSPSHPGANCHLTSLSSFRLSFRRLFAYPTKTDLGRIFPKGCTIMAKKELQWTPLLGQFMTLSHAVFVNRSKRSDAVAVFAKVAETMQKKKVGITLFCLPSKLKVAKPLSSQLSLFIFPEGTRSASSSPMLLPFKKGPFHLAVAAQVPIVPIVCENYWKVYSSKEGRFDGGEVVIQGMAVLYFT